MLFNRSNCALDIFIHWWDETLFTESWRDSDTASTVWAPIPKLSYSFPRVWLRKDTVAAVKGKTILTIPAARSDIKIGSILQTAYSVHLRKGAGFISFIISSFFSTAHQCFNSWGSGIKGLNLPICRRCQWRQWRRHNDTATWFHCMNRTNSAGAVWRLNLRGHSRITHLLYQMQPSMLTVSTHKEILYLKRHRDNLFLAC